MNCRHCGNTVEAFSDLCPHCRKPLGPESPTRMRASNSVAKNIWLAVAVAFALVGSVLAVVTLGCVALLAG
jgi:predicted amidophosphoribosyltransferase